MTGNVKLEEALKGWSAEEIEVLSEVLPIFLPAIKEFQRARRSLLTLHTDVAQLSLALAIKTYVRDKEFSDEKERKRAASLLERFRREFGHGRGRETLLDLLQTSQRDLNLLPRVGKNILEEVTKMLEHFNLATFRAK